MAKIVYQKEWPLLAAAYRAAGLSAAEIAEQFGVPERQFAAFCRRVPELDRAVRCGRIADPVEEALLRRAIGFKHSEVVKEEIVDKNTGEVLETCKCRTVQKEVPPDVRALLFWLKNRRPDRWRERLDAVAGEIDFTPDDQETEL